MLREIEALVFRGLGKCIQEQAETGLVLAGLGREDRFPKLTSTTIRGRLAGKLRATHTQSVEISLSRPSHLETFAQDEQAWGWLAGITKEVRSAIISHWIEWVENLEDEALEALQAELPGMQDQEVSKIAAVFAKIAQDRVHVFGKEMGDREVSLYLSPMLDSIAALPKDELGVLAGSLVNLTSLKQRVSIFELNTVGGPIDVAMISPGDGLVWLNRKHYFSSELNPSWHLTHSGMINVGPPTRGRWGPPDKER